MSNRPGGAMATRPLHFIWIADCSGSMSIDGKIQSLNQAIRDALPHMKDEAKKNPNAEVLIRALKFSSGAQWHVGQATALEDFKWEDMSADGVTDMGKALSMLAEQMKMPPMEKRALPPVLVLLSDGQPTDDYATGLQELFDQPWGKKAVRIAIAIGKDVDLSVLQKFINHPEIKPLQATNPEKLTAYIKWVSTQVVSTASSPKSDSGDGGDAPIPDPPDDITDGVDASDVW